MKANLILDFSTNIFETRLMGYLKLFGLRSIFVTKFIKNAIRVFLIVPLYGLKVWLVVPHMKMPIFRALLAQL